MTMTSEIAEIVGEYREKGVMISDKTFEELHELCERKMTVGGITDREAYRPLLFRDVLEEYVFRCFLNAVSTLMISESEEDHV